MTGCFVILFVGTLMLLIVGRIGILVLCSFSCACSVRGVTVCFGLSILFCVYLRFYWIVVTLCLLDFGICQ
jgi:hypothetical protein